MDINSIKDRLYLSAYTMTQFVNDYLTRDVEKKKEKKVVSRTVEKTVLDKLA